MTASMHQQVLTKMISWAPGLLRGVNSLQLQPEICDVNYVIGRNEYLISTLSESTVPSVYSQQFLFKSTHHSWRNWVGVFFPWF